MLTPKNAGTKCEYFLEPPRERCGREREVGDGMVKRKHADV
jgi:hypothetical protein